MQQPWGMLDAHAAVAGAAIGYAYYPTTSDLAAFLEDAGIAPSDFRLQASVASGIDEVESRCMRHFLAGKHTDNSVEPAYARLYDPPSISGMPQESWGATLDLGAWGDLARLDSVIYQYSGGQPTVYVAGQDFRTMPQNALNRGRPITSLEFVTPWWRPTPQMQWGSIQVTGLWGYAVRIPPVAWDAMVSASALNLFAGEFRGAGVPLGLKSWTGPDGISKTYDATMLTSRLAEWQDDIQTAVTAYGRWGFG